MLRVTWMISGYADNIRHPLYAAGRSQFHSGVGLQERHRELRFQRDGCTRGDYPAGAYHLSLEQGWCGLSSGTHSEDCDSHGPLGGCQWKPLKGHHVINHASRGVSEVDGFFSMELSEKSPTLEVRHDSQLLCQFRLDHTSQRRENDVLMVGDLKCHPDTLAEAAYKSEKAS